MLKKFAVGASALALMLAIAACGKPAQPGKTPDCGPGSVPYTQCGG